MTDFKDIDDLFKANENDWSGKPSDAVWDKLSDNLDDYNGQKQHSNRLTIRWSIAASVVLLLGLTYLFSTSPNLQKAQLAESSDQVITVPVANEWSEEALGSNVESRKLKVDETKISKHDTPAIINSEIINKNPRSISTVSNTKEPIQNKKTKSFGSNLENKNMLSDNEVMEEENELDQILNDDITQDEDESISTDRAEFIPESDLDDQIKRQDRVLTVVSNSLGIAAQKAEHQQDKKSKDIGVGDAYADKSIDDALEESAILPSVAQVSEVNRALAKEQHTKKSKAHSNDDRLSFRKQENYAALSNKKIYVIYPSENGDSCSSILSIDQNNARILDCNFTEIGNDFPLNKTLNEFYSLTISEFKEIEFKEVYLDCLEKKQLKIIVEYGMDSKRFKETTIWNLNCISSSNKSYIKQIEKILIDGK